MGFRGERLLPALLSISSLPSLNLYYMKLASPKFSLNSNNPSPLTSGIEEKQEKDWIPINWKLRAKINKVMSVEIPTKGGGLMGQAEQNPIAVVQAKFKEVENRFRGWLAKQSLPVEAAVVTVTSGAQGAAIGAFMGTLTGDVSSLVTPPPNAANLNPEAMASLKQAQALAGGPLVQARNFAVMTGVNAGISCVMRRLRGKEDVQSSMVAAFGSGAMFSLVSGMGGPNQATNVVTSGLFFALVQGGIFQLGQKFSQPPAEDVYYVKTRSMLSNLGLQNYEKNFKKGLLTDSTLPLLTDSALRDVKIPPGPRLLILDHVDRNPELKERQKRSP